jgi:hypothetical protein
MFVVFPATNEVSPYLRFYDNDGVQRCEIPLEAYGTKRLLLYEDLMFFKVSENKFVGINRLGEAVKIFTADNYTFGEDYCFDKNNDILMPTAPTLQLFAYRLAQATRTSDINIKAQKTPVIALCDDKQKISFKRALDKIEENEFAIYGYKNFDIDSIKAVRLDAPIVFDKLTLQKHEIWNEAMTFLGLNNANQDKKERLVADEVSANNEQVGASGNVFLSAQALL